MRPTSELHEPPTTIVIPIEELGKIEPEYLSDSSLSETSRIGNYQLVERIGYGGMGEVFRAVHVWLGREVAIKRIRPERMGSSDAVKWFLDEVRTAALVDNPFVVRAFDAGTEGDFHYLVMEFIDGIDLRTLVEKNGPFGAYEALRVGAEVAMGLAHLDRLGLVHRDIKPTNLIRSNKTGSVKLLDLGLARKRHPIFNEKLDIPLTGKELLGTPDFMAPEQAVDAREVDIRSDLYSLGCTLYYLLSGQVPFPGGSLVRKVLCQYSENPKALDKLRPELPQDVTNIVHRLMEKKPEDRYQSPKDLLESVGPPLIRLMNEHSKTNRVEYDWDFWLRQTFRALGNNSKFPRNISNI